MNNNKGFGFSITSGIGSAGVVFLKQNGVQVESHCWVSLTTDNVQGAPLIVIVEGLNSTF